MNFIRLTMCNASSEFGYLCEAYATYPDPLPDHLHYHNTAPLTKSGREDRRYTYPTAYDFFWNDDLSIREIRRSWDGSISQNLNANNELENI